MAKRINKGDLVVVISGEARNLTYEKRTGKVKNVDRKKNRVYVEGINIKKVTLKRSAKAPKGGIIEKECPLHISNVMLKEKYDAKLKNRGMHQNQK